MTFKKMANILGAAFLAFAIFAPLVPVKAAGEMFITPNNQGETEIATTNWVGRISFRSPIRIYDSVSKLNYGVDDSIFGSETSSFLNDGGDSDAYYFYAPLDDKGNPIYRQGNECMTGFLLRLGSNGEDAAISIAQPVSNFQETTCGLVTSAETPVKYGRQSGAILGNLPLVGKEYFVVGSFGGADMDGTNYGNALDGNDARWRGITSSLYWIDEKTIGAFDDKNKGDGFSNFKLATDGALANAKADWESNPANSRLSDAQVKAPGWKFFIASSCANAYIAVNSDNTMVYMVNAGVGVKSYESGPFDQCIWGRNIEGIGASAFEISGIPTPIAYPEYSKLAENTNLENADFAGSGGTGDTTATVTPKNQDTICAENAGALGWVLCPILKGLDVVVNWAEDGIGSFLYINPDQFSRTGENGKSDGLYKAWSTFRGIATVVIVIIALIMIFSEAMGQGIFDNYSVKKLLPRLLMAGIAIQLSWFLMTELVKIFNILGNGISGLMLQPFGIPEGGLSELLPDVNSAAGGLLVGIAAGAAIAGLIFGIVGFGIAIASALLIGYVTLIVRTMIIYLGIVFAPVAIALSVLPGTQKTSKWWWESFEKALLMYPFVMALLSIGKITSWMLIQTDVNGAGEIGGKYMIAAIAAWYAPFFFIPKALQAGGAALGKISGFANDRSKGLFDKARGWDKNRKNFNKQLKDERRAAKAGEAGFGGSIARTRMAIGAGMIPTSRRKLLRTSAAVSTAANKAEQAELGDAQVLMERRYRQHVKERVEKGLKPMQGKEFYLEQAKAAPSGSAVQTVAFEQLIKTKAVNEIAEFGDWAAKTNDTGAMNVYKQSVGKNFGDVKGPAPHLATASFEKNASTGAMEFKQDLNSFRTASTEAASEWGADTWHLIAKDINLSTSPEIKQLAKEIDADMRLKSKLAKGDTSKINADPGTIPLHTMTSDNLKYIGVAGIVDRLK